MPFSSVELRLLRKGWDSERRSSEKTDPDYEDTVETKIINDILTLDEEWREQALMAFPEKQRQRLRERLDAIKKPV